MRRGGLACVVCVCTRSICTLSRASHCSLQLRVTSRVQTMSFRFARLRILPALSLSVFLERGGSPARVSAVPSARPRRACTRIRAPTRLPLRFRDVRVFLIPLRATRCLGHLIEIVVLPCLFSFFHFSTAATISFSRTFLRSPRDLPGDASFSRTCENPVV